MSTNKETFERYLNLVARQIGTETGTTKPRHRFDQGYAFGKLLGRAMRDMSDLEKVEFGEGINTGYELEAGRKSMVH